jgi:hypothetical protein
MSTGSDDALTAAQVAPMMPLILPDDSQIPTSLAGSDTAEYEHYFHILRTGPDLRSWIRNCLDLQAAILSDLFHVSLDERQRVDLLIGLLQVSDVTLMSLMNAAPPAPHHRPTKEFPAFTAPPVLDQVGALRRWKLGHQLFHMLLVPMNTLLEETLAATRNAEWPCVVSGIEQLRALYDAATATMTYASDFSSATYREKIRPTMEPPFVGPGFSGIFNREHQVMVDRLRTLRRMVKALPPEIEPIDAIRRVAASLEAAQRRNQHNHFRICKRFVPDGVSLLQQHLDRERKQETDTGEGLPREESPWTT